MPAMGSEAKIVITAKPEYKIVPFGANLMRLYDEQTGDAVITANRPEDKPEWTITGGKGKDTTAKDREAAVWAMCDKLGPPAHSVQTFPGWKEMP